MDSVTQFVLGAAVGEATLRTPPPDSQKKPFGIGAVLLGGLVGTLPDLDVLAAPFLDGPTMLSAHRGPTHSLFFCTLFTPILAVLLRWLYRDRQIELKRWMLFAWLGLNTHWMLDCFTMYGTQIFQPFSNFPVNGSSVFIIDPIYTLSLAFGVVVSLWASRGERPHNAKGAKLGLAVSTLYLLLTVCSKQYVMQRFDASWAESGREKVARITVPTPFNSILWYCYVDTGTDVWVADSSLFDSPERVIKWQRVPKNLGLLEGFGEGKAGKVLLWFSRGFYRLDVQDGQPVFIDLRFGRLKSWLLPREPEGTDYIFRYNLKPSEMEGPYQDFTAPPPQGGFGQFPWKLFWERIRGRE